MSRSSDVTLTLQSKIEKLFNLLQSADLQLFLAAADFARIGCDGVNANDSFVLKLTRYFSRWIK